MIKQEIEITKIITLWLIKYEHIGSYKNKLYAYNGSTLNGDVVKQKRLLFNRYSE